MDLYSTDELLGIRRRLIIPQRWLTQNYFSSVRTSQSKFVHIDVEKGGRRLAPFVHPRSQGKIVESYRYQTDTIEPAYIKDKRAFDPEDAIDTRSMGEALTGSMSPAQREAAWVSKTLADQQDMIDRRLEWMAASALRTATVLIDGDGFDAINVDFGRDAAHTITLAGALSWDGGANKDPIANLETWAGLAEDAEGLFPSDVIMDPEGWKLFREDAKVEKLLDTRRGSDSRIESVGAGRAPTRRGEMGPFTFYTMQETYLDDAGATQKLLPDNTVLMVPPELGGIQHYGAIRDKRAGYAALPFFPKMWEDEDPSTTYLMAQSAPILNPFRPDATIGATVA